MSMRYHVESAGGVASRTSVGGHELIFDQPEKFGGQDRGPSPLEVLVASTGACAHYYAAAFLVARRLPTDGLSVDIVADKSSERPQRVTHMHLTVHLPPGVPEELLPRLEAAVRACPAHNTMSGCVAFDIDLLAGSEPSAEVRSASVSAAPAS